MLKVGVISVLTLGLAWAAMYLPFDVYSAHDFWKSNPTMFLVRLSLVGVVASCIFLAEHWSGAKPWVPSILGRESLFIYILHLVIVYGSVLNRGLAQRAGPLWITGSVGVFIAVLAAITIVTLLWHHFKTNHENAASWVVRGGAAAFLIAFLVRPW
jgi:ABC-type enterochelin transport system permease subunit